MLTEEYGFEIATDMLKEIKSLYNRINKDSFSEYVNGNNYVLRSLMNNSTFVSAPFDFNAFYNACMKVLRAKKPIKELKAVMAKYFSDNLVWLEDINEYYYRVESICDFNLKDKERLLFHGEYAFEVGNWKDNTMLLTALLNQYYTSVYKAYKRYYQGKEFEDIEYSEDVYKKIATSVLQSDKRLVNTAKGFDIKAFIEETPSKKISLSKLFQTNPIEKHFILYIVKNTTPVIV